MLKRIFRLAHRMAKEVHTVGNYGVTFGACLRAVYVELRSMDIQKLEKRYSLMGIKALVISVADALRPNIQVLAKQLKQLLKTSDKVDTLAKELGARVVTKRSQSWIIKTEHSMLELWQTRKGFDYQIMLDGD